MTVEPCSLGFHRFSDDPLLNLDASIQRNYVRKYLRDLKAESVVEEPRYFDRDYLEQVTAYYARSVANYPNYCTRLHYFSTPVTRERFLEALENPEGVDPDLQEAYLGFIVVRPLPGAPFGRTVLRWYEDRTQDTWRRITTPSRNYTCHVAGLKLVVNGLAWQQQDAAVATCSTVALWTMMQSSAFGEHHAVPFTAELTEFANQRSPVGKRVFPSDGLVRPQILEAIKACGLDPIVCLGDLVTPYETLFSPEHFAKTCTALVRSGYPVLVAGFIPETDRTEHAWHAVCVVGVREAPVPSVPAGGVLEQDSEIRTLYVHDDNLGPSVRFVVGAQSYQVDESMTVTAAALVSETPDPYTSEPITDPTSGCGELYPVYVIAAVHRDLRSSIDQLHTIAQEIVTPLAKTLEALSSNLSGLTVTSRFIRTSHYLCDELPRLLTPITLARVRLRLREDVPPMSEYVGLIHIGIDGNPVLDVLVDTTDALPNQAAFCHLALSQNISSVILRTQTIYPSFPGLGVCIPAF